MNKRRKVTEQKAVAVDGKTDKEPEVKKTENAKEEKPWDGKEEKEDDQDYRWNLCEGCQ